MFCADHSDNEKRQAPGFQCACQADQYNGENQYSSPDHKPGISILGDLVTVGDQAGGMDRSTDGTMICGPGWKLLCMVDETVRKCKYVCVITIE